MKSIVLGPEVLHIVEREIDTGDLNHRKTARRGAGVFPADASAENIGEELRRRMLVARGHCRVVELHPVFPDPLNGLVVTHRIAAV